MKISVVTPSYNQAEYVQRTLESVMEQDGVAVEYIVIDGGSDDGSREILESLAPRLDVLVIEPDDGQADAIRKGFERASGDILCFLNSDDTLQPKALRYVAGYFESHPQIDAIYSHRLFIDEQDQIQRFWILPPHNSYCMRRWDFIPQETCFWRRSLMERAGGIDPSFQFALDYDLFVRMMAVGKFERVPRFLAAFRVHGEAKSTLYYETVGRTEIARVQAQNGIRLHWYDTLVKYAFGGSILSVSFLFKLLFLHAIRRRHERR